MAETRICFVGGGSYNWMPKLLGDLALTPELHGSVVLHDLNPSALEDIQRYGHRVFDANGSRFSIETTTDLERALDSAEFVVVTITTGGLPTMALDLDIPERYGILSVRRRHGGPGRTLAGAAQRAGHARHRASHGAPLPGRLDAQPDQSPHGADPSGEHDDAHQSHGPVSRAIRRPKWTDAHVRRVTG